MGSAAAHYPGRRYLPLHSIAGMDKLSGVLFALNAGLIADPFVRLMRKVDDEQRARQAALDKIPPMVIPGVTRPFTFVERILERPAFRPLKRVIAYARELGA